VGAENPGTAKRRAKNTKELNTTSSEHYKSEFGVLFLKLKYCPQCAGFDIAKSLNGERCRRCNYVGTMREGSIDEINSFKKNLKGGNSQTSILKPPKELSGAGAENDVPLKEKIKKRPELQSNEDWEIF